jgi:hypothetical protein
MYNIDHWSPCGAVVKVAVVGQVVERADGGEEVLRLHLRLRSEKSKFFYFGSKF